MPAPPDAAIYTWKINSSMWEMNASTWKINANTWTMNPLCQE